MHFNDLELIKILGEKDTYEKYSRFVNVDVLETHVQTIFFDMDSYFKEFDDFDISTFRTWFFHYAHTDLPKNKQDVFKLIFDRLETIKTSVAEKVLIKFKEFAAIQHLEEHFEKGLDIEYVRELIDSLEADTRSITEEDASFIPNDLDKIVMSTKRDNSLKWRLDCLNKSTGGLLKGDFVIIAAYVDVGKTTLAISEAAYMAQQLENSSVLWLNNEEYDNRVWKKLWQAVLGQPWREIVVNPTLAREKYIKLMNNDINRIRLVDIRNKTLTEILSIVKKIKPGLVIIDQLDKISTPKYKAWSDHDRLKHLYGAIRDICNAHCPIIGISQADATTRWKDKETGKIQYQLYPDHSQLDGSKIGKPGEADVIIMIGQRLGSPDTRGLHISKNKLDGVEERYRKAKVEVIFAGDISRYLNPLGENDGY